MARLALPILDVRIETPRTRTVRLSLANHTFTFLPGQAAWLGQHGRPLRKPYSIACSPEQMREMNGLEFLIQVLDDGTVGPHLDPPTPGMLLDLEGPFGAFSFPASPPGRAFLLVAGGTGIAPLRAMLWHALVAFPDRRLALLYSARSAAEFAYARELRELASAGRIVLQETVTREEGAPWAGVRGRITKIQLAAYVNGADTLCCVCGPAALVRDVSAWLLELGVPASRILAERE